MRSVIEILIIGGLIYLGWEQPFKQRADEVKQAIHTAGHALEHPTSSETPRTVPPATPAATATPTPIPQPRAISGAPTPSPHGAWMWDEKHRSVLDRPAYDQTQPAQRYHDEYGRSYWIDANGVRHYDQ
jgi:hypothetical protein